MIEGQLAPFTWTSPKATTAKPSKGAIVTLNGPDQNVLNAMQVDLSTNGGLSWISVPQSSLGQEFPLSGNPVKIQARIRNITTELMQDYSIHVKAVPGTEPTPESGTPTFATDYTYDDYGNRLTETSGGTTTNYDYYPHSDQLWHKGDTPFT